jgi:hypothetical protein
MTITCDLRLMALQKHAECLAIAVAELHHLGWLPALSISVSGAVWLGWDSVHFHGTNRLKHLKDDCVSQ